MHIKPEKKQNVPLKKLMRLRLIVSIFISALLFFAILLGIRFGNFKKLFGFDTKIVSFLQLKTEPSGKKSKNTSSHDQIIKECFKKLEIPDSQIKRRFYLEDSTLSISISVPQGKPMEWIIWFISSSVTKAGYLVDDCYYPSEKNGCKIEFSSTKPELPKLNIQVNRSSAFFTHTAKMAILVEDFGFEADQTTIGFLSFSEPLTVSLASPKKLSTWTAQIANEYKKEIVILLPMEPLPGTFSKYNSSVIMVHYPEDQIRSMIAQMTDAIPNFAGFCNFYGDRVLADSHVMSIIYDEVKKNHAYFLIDPGTRKSIAETLAKKMEIPYENITFSINTDLSAAAIQDTLLHFALIAQNKGSVLLKGKASPSFLAAVTNTKNLLHENGIRLVYASEIIKHPEEE